VCIKERVEIMTDPSRDYLRAARYDWILPLYDPVMRLLGADEARDALLDQGSIRPGDRVLDIGCGTGTFATLIKRLHPDVEVVGLDPDPKALARARRKAERESVEVRFDQGFADALPYPEASFDRVFSSFMFHHLSREEKEGTLREVRRVLKPDGTLHLLDFGGPESSADGFLSRLLYSRHGLKDNSEERVLSLMKQAGYADPEKVKQGSRFFGLLDIYYFRAWSSPSLDKST
jgi:ubiquinone/menaquinone biosynthesis C-methylase UbiE